MPAIATVDIAAMSPRDPDLEILNALLGRCLGRIDEVAYRLQQDTDVDDELCADRLEEHTTTLEELIGSMLFAGADESRANANEVIERVLQSFLGELEVPIVVRQRLSHDLPPVACPRGLLALAVQRALDLVADDLGPGSELLLATRVAGDAAILEFETRGGASGRLLADRSATLCEFIRDLGGRCAADADAGQRTSIALGLPLALAAEDC